LQLFNSSDHQEPSILNRASNYVHYAYERGTFDRWPSKPRAPSIVAD